MVKKHIIHCLLIGSIVVLSIASSCKKSSSVAYMNNATITNFSFTVPLCGAPYTVVIHGIADSNAQFESLPAGSNISTFPTNVKLNWHHIIDSQCLGSNNIFVDAIEKVN
jgi:hypothetical protein